MKKKKKIKVKKEKKVKTPKPMKVIDPKKDAEIDITAGLEQCFVDKKGNDVMLLKFLKKEEWWTLKKRDRISVILTHDGVKRIADAAGILGNYDIKVLTDPNPGNNNQYWVQITICDGDGRCTTETGESNRGNLGSRGRNNPANMAQKRGYDRAVLRHLGINGLLGEDDIDEDKEENMKTLSPEEAKTIAPLINELLAVKKKADIDAFNKKMKQLAPTFKEEQLSVLRNLRDKQQGALGSTF